MQSYMSLARREKSTGRHDLLRVIAPKNEKLKIKFINGTSRSTAQKGSAIFSLSLRLYNEPEELVEAVKLTLQTFESCEFVISDSLHRYNYLWQRDMTPENAYSAAIQEGDNWIAWFCSLQGLSSLDIKIIRWDYWLQHPLFEEQQTIVENIYAKNQAFAFSIQESIELYLSRYAKSSPSFEITKARQASIALVKEEVAVLLIQAKLDYAFEVFIEQRNPGLQYFYRQILWKKFPALLQPALIKVTL